MRAAYPDDELRVRRMSIVQDHAVRMAYLATVAGVKVNGVAELQSRLLRDKVLPDFSQYWPEKFTNVTNGITPRRFMRLANPSLSQVITAAIGVGWVTNLDRLEGLEPFAEEPEFRQQFRRAKEANKTQLRALLRVRDGIDLPQGHMLDVMVKRLHEYKRQMLKVLHIITLYDGILSGELDPSEVTPRTFIFGAKAAPGLLHGQGDHPPDQRRGQHPEQ